MRDIKIGSTHEESVLVAVDNLAPRFVVGTPEAFATPALVALIELTASQLVAGYLEPDETTAGTRIEISHTAPTPPGMTIRCQARLVEVDRRRVRFEVAAWDDKEKVCEGAHERFVVNYDRFATTLNNKAH